MGRFKASRPFFYPRSMAEMSSWQELVSSNITDRVLSIFLKVRKHILINTKITKTGFLTIKFSLG